MHKPKALALFKIRNNCNSWTIWNTFKERIRRILRKCGTTETAGKSLKKEEYVL